MKTTKVQKISLFLIKMKSKKYTNFGSKLGKLEIQLEVEYYKNGENAQIQ